MDSSETKNIIKRIEDLYEAIDEIKQNKKEMKKNLNEARLELTLVEPTIETEISLVEIERLDISFPYFDVLSKQIQGEHLNYAKQIRGIIEDFSEIKQKIISLDCELEILDTKYK